MIVLQIPGFSENGNIKIAELSDSKLNDSTRRVSRRKTINGGVFLDDLGFSHGDRTFEIKANSTAALIANISQLKQVYSQCQCITSEGVFLGVIRSITENGNVLTTQFLIKEKVI